MTPAELSPALQIAPTLARLEEAIARLRALTQKDIQPHWRWWTGEECNQIATPWDTWPTAPLNDRQQIAWEKGQRVLWLGQRLRVPTDLQGYPLEGLTLRLALIWWAEAAQVFVDGNQVQEGDLFDCSARILLRERVQPGEEVAIALRLVSPGHDNGALVRSLCVYERPYHGMNPCPEPGFVADELAVLRHYLETFAPEQLPELAAAVDSLPWERVGEERFEEAIATLRQHLLPLGEGLKQRTIHLLGHAHLDLAWLWTVDETWRAAELTFRSVLNLMENFPELTFCHSSPALFAWLEENRPALFAAIQAQVRAGRWEIAAGMWVEPELNVVSGESIARQILYGQRYCQEKFGAISTIAWLPDTFGFPWQLPQLLKQGGIEYFVTQKLRWNDTTVFPHELFTWQATDGSAVLSLHSAPIGEGIDPLKMIRYACQFEQKTGIPDALWLVGVGDHGGGPSRDMLEVARRWGRSPFFPQLGFTTAARYLENVQDRINQEHLNLPVWNTELYLEFHRGCYTTHADQKRLNRRCEDLLYEAELFAAFATLSTGVTYPGAALETAWKRVLFNQFHDILPGSAIAPVYEDANREWAAAMQTGQTVLRTALEAIAHRIQLPPPPHPAAQPLMVFNALNWERSHLVSLSAGALPNGDGWHVCDLAGAAIALQSCRPQPDTQPQYILTFQADQIPALGYRCFWLCPGASPAAAATGTGTYVLENECLRVRVNPDTGDLDSVFDKRHQREVLSGPGNQLQAFRDEGQYWDAWNIDPAYAQHPLPGVKLRSLQAFPDPLHPSIRVERQIGQSVLLQTYTLPPASAVLQIHTQTHWQESHVLLKAAFPLNLEADTVTYETAAGAIQRPTRPQTEAEQAQWEVPALRWADLSRPDYGVSLLSDCKHGYDSQPNPLRLTLLRGSVWPDPHADTVPPNPGSGPQTHCGFHEFTYALYPHAGDWRSAQTVRRSHELNQPLHLLQPTIALTPAQPQLPPVGQFLHLEANNLVLTAFKRCETNPNQWVLRCYECHGVAIELKVGETVRMGEAIGRDRRDFTLLHPVNLLENSLGIPPGAALPISPWEIATALLGP